MQQATLPQQLQGVARHIPHVTRLPQLAFQVLHPQVVRGALGAHQVLRPLQVEPEPPAEDVRPHPTAGVRGPRGVVQLKGLDAVGRDHQDAMGLRSAALHQQGQALGALLGSGLSNLLRVPVGRHGDHLHRLLRTSKPNRSKIILSYIIL